jgi:hypothetical protein
LTLALSLSSMRRLRKVNSTLSSFIIISKE